MTQQPNQNYPQQPGQGWGQQQPAPQDQWGQPQQPAAPQWGQQQQAYGQPAPQWGAPAATTGTAGGGALGKPWALYAGLGAAVIAGIMAFLPWVSEKVTASEGSFTATITAMGHATLSSGGKSQGGNADGFNKTWGILLLVSAVIVLAGAILTIVTKQKPALLAALGGSGLVLVFALVETLYINSKFSDEKKSIAAEFGSDPSAKYSIGLGWAAYVGLVLGIAAVAFMVLAFLSFGQDVAKATGAAAYADYGQQAAYGQPSAYGQPAGYQQPQAQQQWGQPAPQQQPQQPQAQQWGQPAAPQQQGWGQPADPANQPTQAVQQYPPQQQ